MRPTAMQRLSRCAATLALFCSAACAGQTSSTPPPPLPQRRRPRRPRLPRRRPPEGDISRRTRWSPGLRTRSVHSHVVRITELMVRGRGRLPERHAGLRTVPAGGRRPRLSPGTAAQQPPQVRGRSPRDVAPPVPQVRAPSVGAAGNGAHSLRLAEPTPIRSSAPDEHGRPPRTSRPRHAAGCVPHGSGRTAQSPHFGRRRHDGAATG